MSADELCADGEEVDSVVAGPRRGLTSTHSSAEPMQISSTPLKSRTTTKHPAGLSTPPPPPSQLHHSIHLQHPHSHQAAPTTTNMATTRPPPRSSSPHTHETSQLTRRFPSTKRRITPSGAEIFTVAIPPSDPDFIYPLDAVGEWSGGVEVVVVVVVELKDRRGVW